MKHCFLFCFIRKGSVSRSSRVRLGVSALIPMFLFILPLFAQWAPDQRLTLDGSFSYTSYNNARCIASGPGQTIHVVWYDGRNGQPEIYYKRSTDGGNTWSSDMRLTVTPTYSDYPAIAVEDSTLHVVWMEKLDSGGSWWEVYYVRSTDGGITWGPIVPLTDNGGNKSWFPSVAVSDTQVHVVWDDNRDGGNGEIYYRRSTDNGITWEPETRLTFESNASVYPSISAVGSDVHLVWYDTRNANYDIYYKHSSNGGANWGADTRLTSDPAWSYFPCVSAADGQVHLVFGDNRDGNSEIYYKRSPDNGLTWSPDQRLTYDGSTSGYGTIMNSGPNVHIAWEEQRDGNREIYYKYSADGGISWETDYRLTQDPAVSALPSIAVTDTIVHVVWEDTRDGNLEIYYKRNPTGNIGVEETDNRYQITDQVFPNPFVSYTRILGYEQESFTLYDISGRVVGAYKGDRIGVDLSPGVYFLMSENNNTKPIRIVKVR